MIPLPVSLAIPTLADWAHEVWCGDESNYDVQPSTRIARAVRALVEAKVREALIGAITPESRESIVARVMA